MSDYRSLSHARWECKYHVVFIPKYRKKAIYGELRKDLGNVFRTLAEQRESYIEEGHLMPDHVHIMISIPPKHAVAQVVGYTKGKIVRRNDRPVDLPHQVPGFHEERRARVVRRETCQCAGVVAKVGVVRVRHGIEITTIVLRHLDLDDLFGIRYR